MKPEELPEDIRLKLSDQDLNSLWSRIEDYGGVKKFSEDSNFNATDIYNWKNKESYVPVGFLQEFPDILEEEEVESFKGASNSKPVKKPEFPLDIGEELLTRIETSVVVNRDGTPVYLTDERSLMERFNSLLQRIGDVPVTRYSGDRYRLRFPSYLHSLLKNHSLYSKVKKEPHTEAIIDEKGEVKDGYVDIHGEEIAFSQIGTLYSRDKRLQIALQTENKEEIQKIIGETAQAINSLK